MSSSGVLPDDESVREVDLAAQIRLVEALLFASAEPLDEVVLRARLPEGVDLSAILEALQRHYAPRGVNLVRLGGRWSFRTADDLAWLMARDAIMRKKKRWMNWKRTARLFSGIAMSMEK